MAEDLPPQEDKLGDLIILKPPPKESGDEKAPLRERPREYKGYCGHRRIELDREVERAFCRDCKTEVPLFKVLETFASDFEHHVAARDAAERDSKAAREQLAALVREVKNTKSRRRRWRVKADEDWNVALYERGREIETRRVSYAPLSPEDIVVTALCHPDKFEISVKRKS